MKRVVIFGICIALAACGPSQEDIENVAIITCNIMGESRNMDAAMRIKEINAAREKIGAKPYLGTDATIKESFEWGLCRDLVKDETVYQSKLRVAKAAFRVEQEKLEREAELARLEEERQREQRLKIDTTPISMVEAMSKGQDLYNASCSACHGLQGEGGIGPALSANAMVTGNNQTAHAEVIWNGVAGSAMYGFGEQISLTQLASLMTYSANAFGNDSGLLIQPHMLAALLND